jgi:ABC-type transporter Mla MlaB component
MTAQPDLVIEGPIELADLVGLSARVRELLAPPRDAHRVVCDVGRLDPGGLDAVAMLAQLQLTARRAGGRIEVIGASPDLHEVLAMAGLCRALGLRPALCLEAGWQAEHREEASGVEEERDPADPVARELEDLD